jgi:coatomer subunit alpha
LLCCISSTYHNLLYLVGLAYVTAVTHGLQEEAAPLAEKLQQTLGRIPGSPPDPKLLLPLNPVIQSSESNWPLLTVQKSLLHKMLQQEAKGSAASLEMPEEEIGDAWGGGDNDLFGGEEKGLFLQPTLVTPLISIPRFFLFKIQF